MQRMKALFRLILGAVFLAAALCVADPGRARAMDLEGRITHPWSLEVRNPYAGTCVEVRADIGDTVEAGGILAVYRLDNRDRENIQQTLSESELRSRQGELRLLEAQGREASARRDKLREALAAGVESQARLEANNANVELLEQQISSLRADIQELAARLREDRDSIREDLGGAPIPADNAPREAFLRSPTAGVVSGQEISPRDEMPKGKLCFRVARSIFHVSCRISAADYVRLKAGDVGRATIQSLPGESFEAVLLPLPLTAEDKGPNAAAAYEVEFLIRGLDRFVSEDVRARVNLAK
ncbi:MAG TPA: hypothetical protein DDW80_00715 [Desulfovibrio sp.]|nr:hypothetical protein [Desulfovibrio sp.]